MHFQLTIITVDNMQYFIFAFLLAINIGWFVAYCCKQDDEVRQLKKLVDEKIAQNEPYNEDELEDEIEPKQAYAWIYSIVICLDIWIVGAIFTHWWAGSFFKVSGENSPEASFGDSFGAVNALISAFAFAGMIVAFILQRYELRLQRRELKAQRDEFSQQNNTLRLQRFENTFFNMLELQQKIVNDLSADNVGFNNNIKGRSFFRYAFEECEHHVELQPHKEDKIMGLHNVMEKYGFSHYDNYYTSTYFDHYFRHFYRILKFVDQNNWLGIDEQYKYTSMLRGILSRYELVWLFYNGLSENGRDKLKPLMEKYTMLKNLRVDLLAFCKENRDKLIEADISLNALRENGFSGSDYEFTLSDEKDTDKYYLGAFYSKEEISTGIDLYERWKQFCLKKRISI